VTIIRTVTAIVVRREHTTSTTHGIRNPMTSATGGVELIGVRAASGSIIQGQNTKPYNNATAMILLELIRTTLCAAAARAAQ